MSLPIVPDKEKGKNVTFWLDPTTDKRIDELKAHYGAGRSSTIKQLVAFAHEKMLEQKKAAKKGKKRNAA